MFTGEKQTPSTTEIEPTQADIVLCAYKEDELCTADERRIRVREYTRCANSYWRFRDWCRLAETPPPGQNTGGGIIPFETWPHTEVMVSAFLKDRHIAILKSRQIGVSWEVAAYTVWQALFKPAFKALLFSKGMTEASELLSKCRFVYDHLPAFLRIPLGADSKTEMAFPSIPSVIMALPATQSAGVSFTASLLVYDEWEQHEYAETNYFNAKPVIDAGGQLIGVFTRDAYKATSLARQIFIDASEGKNSFTPLFFPWNVRPGRDAGWYAATQRSIPTMELGTLTPELYMKCSYPSSAEEALAPLQMTAACDLTVLAAMREDTRSAVRHDRDMIELGLDPNIVNIFKGYSTGAYYVAATDTSHGVGLDDSVTLVLNVKTGEVVADILDSRLAPEQLAVHSVALLKYFHNPLWLIEDNDWGATTVKVAQQLGYRNLFETKDKQGKMVRVGWHTGKITRGLLWGALIPAINNRQLIIYNARGLSQFTDLIRNADEEGRIEAKQGRKDDYPMALAIAYYNRDKVQTDADVYKPIQTLHFHKGDHSNAFRILAGRGSQPIRRIG